MYPVLTFLRHKAIAATLCVARAINRLTKGKRPAFYFTPQDLTPVGSKVRIVSKDTTSVTIAKYNDDGRFADGGFKIMTATDMHLDGENSASDHRAVSHLVRELQLQRPDLLIVTGDVILSDCQQIDAVQFSQMMEKLGVYWCYVFGNHEARQEKEYFKYLLYKGLSYCPHCLNLFGDPSLFGYGNFAVNILKNENEVLKTLFLFDSGRDIQDHVRKELNIPDEIQGYDFIKPTQIQWYLDELKKVKVKYGDTKTLCYMHIPVPEYQEVFDGDKKTGFHDSGKTQLIYGEQHESVGCSGYNSGFFEAALAEGSLQAMFAGHDHVNDFCALYKGVYLIYSQVSGYNTYSGSDFADCDERFRLNGVTLTTLNADGSITPEQKKYCDM